MWAYSVLRIEMKNSLEVKFSKQTCTHAPLVIQPPCLPLSIYVNLNQSKDLLTELNEIFWDSSGTLRVSHGVLGVFFPPCSLVTLDVPTFKYCSHNMDFPHTHPVQLWFEWFLNSHICKKETQRSKLTFTGSEECCAHSWEPILKHTHTHTQQDGLFVLAVSVRFLSIRRWDEKFCNRAVSLAAPTDVRLLHHPVRPARFQPSRSTFIHTPTGAVQHKHPHPPRGVHWAETQYFLTNVSEKKRHTHTRGRVMCDWWSPQGKNAPNIMFKMKPERQKSRNLDRNYFFF